MLSGVNQEQGKAPCKNLQKISGFVCIFGVYPELNKFHYFLSKKWYIYHMPISDVSLRNLLDTIEDGVYFVDTGRAITYWNKGAELITGFTSAEVTGKHCSENILMHVNDSGEYLCLGKCPLQRSIEKDCTITEDIYLHHKEGYRVPINVKTIPFKDAAGKTIGAVEIFRERMAFPARIEELKRMAYFDVLTEVGNRRHAEYSLNSRLQEKIRYGIGFGLLFIDIDNFKKVNDLFGHENGDLVLKMVAKTISKNIRPFDNTSRWGGEEFLVLLVNITNSELALISEKLRMLVSTSMVLVENKPINITVSIGATLAIDKDTPRTLINRADKLMYKSKQNGKNCVTIG